MQANVLALPWQAPCLYVAVDLLSGSHKLSAAQAVAKMEDGFAEDGVFDNGGNADAPLVPKVAPPSGPGKPSRKRERDAGGWDDDEEHGEGGATARARDGRVTFAEPIPTIFAATFHIDRDA